MFTKPVFLAALILLPAHFTQAESTSTAMNCSSSGYRLARCRIAGQAAVLRVDLTQKISRSSCNGTWNYNANLREVAVWSGCRANFRVTFKDAPKVVITDPPSPIDYKRNPALEAAIKQSLRASTLAPEQLAQHALDRLGFGAGATTRIRSLVRLTNGEVDEAKTHGAILRYVMHSLNDSNYERKDIEQMLASNFPNSTDDYSEVTQKSQALLAPVTADRKEIERLTELQKTNPSPKVDADLEHARTLYALHMKAYHEYRYTLWDASQARLIANAVNHAYAFKTKLVYLWFNRLNVNGEKVSFDFTDYVKTIASHTHSTFGEMLLASARHPAMLIYLNNYLNRVDDSKGIRPNEDYGRELMELHTLGITAGATSGPNSYTLEDVRAASRIMAGWTVTTTSSGRQFTFVPRFNPTGGKSLLGTSFADGEAGGIDFIHFLAAHPATAASIAKMLTVYFVSENFGLDETKSLAQDLKASYMASGGNLPRLYQELVSHPSFWSAAAFRSKVNDPFQQVVKTLKAAGYTAANLNRRVLLSNHKEYAAAAAAKKPIPFVPGASATATAMGLNLFRCTPPTGYSIASSRWMSANNALAALRFAFHQADFDGPEYLQTYVDKMESMAEVQMERGNIELAKAYIRAGMAHGYGAIWSTLRFGFPVAKAELVVSNALRSPDKINRQPNYLRTAAGMFFGSLENSIQ